VVLGDVVICPAVLAAEAREQEKVLLQHFAHLVIHGILHLKGFDHIAEREAKEMERLEVMLLGTLGIKNPYLEESL
jgi:probable rRNA maturation factor